MEEVWQRETCAICNTSCKFYCPTCCIPMNAPPNLTVPKIDLPLQVYIYFRDKVKKSTAPHAKVIAPRHSHIIPMTTTSEFPAFDATKTLVVYPTNTAENLFQLNAADLSKIENLVFIDSSWKKAPSVLQHSSLSNLRCVKLAHPPAQSKFWRYHEAGEGCISTIEAIEMMLQEYLLAISTANINLDTSISSSEISKLLFIFKQIYSTIASKHEHDILPMHEQSKENRRRHRSQKDIGKIRKAEYKARKIERNSISTKSDMRKCYNCKEPTHGAKNCPHPCKYCKKIGHWNATCEMKKTLQLTDSRTVTKA
uniref:tRNA-uridine aminocarboxypropyltransferase 1 n=1 Tax=Albugo laibachii Nc14 TaxID=890382 RepID=F0X1N6_9STRA|nr:conserved hypothetical protein [Albugo laibachii Nc14]|eukprot:CCA27733.1 conserved hypothetical protein [Albugo laibachii Nc14]